MSARTSLPTGAGTFQPLRHRSGTLRDRLHGYTKQTLGAGGSLNDAVALPQGESCAGWVAVHAIDLQRRIHNMGSHGRGSIPRLISSRRGIPFWC